MNVWAWLAGSAVGVAVVATVRSYVARDRRHMHDRENASDVLGPNVDVPANDRQLVPKAAE